MPTAAAGTNDVCGGDSAWLTQIVGRPPTKSGLERLDLAAQDPRLRQAFASPSAERGIDGDGGWFKHVVWSSEEVYQWESGSKTIGSVVVARNVTGKDPRTLGHLGEEPAFVTGVPLASGVMEYPPNPAARRAYDSSPGHVLFTFRDGTWVIVTDWMASRFHAVFEKSSDAPALPQTPSDVFVEYCFPNKAQGWANDETLDGSKTSGITMRADHMSMRWVGSPMHVELLYTFATPETAAQAEADQRMRCAQRSCKVSASAVDGRLVRYVL